MIAKKNTSEFISGGGEMGELIRSKDWSKTSLGDFGEWPTGLKTILGLLLNSKFPMFLWWGPELICFYNDAYRPSLGQDGKHPSILGMPGEQAWSEAWHIIKPLVDQVLETGEATWFEDQLVPIYRNGHVEDVYWTFSYSPVMDDAGKRAGVFVTCTETTGKVILLKELEESNKRFFNNIMHAPVAMCIFRGKNHVVEIANERMLELWGKKSEEVIGKPIFEGLPEAKGQGLEALVDHVYSTGEKFVANERPVDLPRNGKIETTYVNFTYEALREPDGSISGMVAVAIEVTEQVVARQKIEESELRFRTMAESSDILIATSDETSKATYFNKPWGELTGRPIKELLDFGWTDMIHQDDRQEFLDIYQGAFKEIKPWTGKFRIINKDGAYRWLLARGQCRFNPDGSFAGYISSSTDITELKRTEEALIESEKRLRNTILQAPVAMCILIGPNFIVELANKLMFEMWGRTAEEMVNKPLFESVKEASNIGFEEMIEGVYRTGTTFSAQSVPTMFKRNGKLEPGYVDVIYQAYRNTKGTIIGVLAIATNVTLQVVARKKIEEAEEKTRLAIHSAELGVYEITYATNRMETDARFKEIWGAENFVERKKYVDAIHPDDLEHRRQAHEESLKTGHLRYTARVIRPDGSIHWVKITGRISYDDKARPIKLFGIAQDITSTVIAQQKIEEKEHDIRSMVLQAPIGICVLDAASLVAEIVNDSFIEVAGKPYEAIAGKHYWDAFAEAKPYYESALNDVIEKGVPFYANEVELMLIRHGKEEIIYVTFVYAPLKNEEGKVKKVAIWVLENTPQVIARKEIAEAEERLRLATEAGGVATFDLDLKTDAIIYSLSLSEIYGLDKEKKYTHSDLRNSIHDEDQGDIVKAFEIALKSGTLTYEARVVKPNNIIGWVRTEGKVLYNEAKDPIKLIGTIRDITEEKERQQELLDSEKRLSIVIDASELGMWEFDLKTEQVSYSDRYLEIFGYDKGSSVKYAELIDRVHIEDRPDRERTLAQAYVSGIIHHKHRLVWNDGSIHWIESKGKVFYDKARKPIKLVGTIRDITEEKYREEELLESEKKLDSLVKDRTMQLERSNEDLQQFAHVASHDLKEPLRKIKMYTNRIDDEYSNILPDTAMDFLGQITSASSRMQMMIDGVLSFSSINSTQQPIQKVNLNEIIENVKSDLEILIGQKNAEIVSEHLPDIEGAEILIYQLFYNLINNSLKFSKPGIAPHISITSLLIDKGNRNYVKILVKDNSIGFEQKYAKQIFDTFVRLNSKDRFEGTGLGLTLCKKIVERHRGEIEASGIINEGAIFTIVLPLKQPGNNI